MNQNGKANRVIGASIVDSDRSRSQRQLADPFG
jgi:hypothetical protein